MPAAGSDLARMDAATDNRNARAARTPLATVAEVARYLSISRSKLYQIMDNGTLPYIKMGKSRRMRWDDVESFIAKNRIGRP
jgi:excisionase family DNA binding protein